MADLYHEILNAERNLIPSARDILALLRTAETVAFDKMLIMRSQTLAMSAVQRRSPR